MEQAYQQTLSQDRTSTKNTNRVQPINENDNHTESLSLPSRHRHHRSHHRHHSHRRSRHGDGHHHHRHHRPRSYSSCSTCSSHSYHTHSDIRSDVTHHRRHHFHQSLSQPAPKIITPRPPKPRTPTPPRAPFSNTLIYRDTGTSTGLETKIMRDSSVTADLEDVPSKSHF